MSCSASNVVTRSYGPPENPCAPATVNRTRDSSPVDAHVAAVLAKLGVRTRGDAVVRYRDSS